MTHVTNVSWLGILAMAALVPVGQWAAVLGVLFAGLLVYIGFRERYLFLWLGGWMFLLLSRGAMNGTAPGMGHHAAPGMDKVLFVLAIMLLSASALYYTEARRSLVWIGLLGSLDLCVVAAQATWFPSSFPLLLCFQILYHAIALIAAVRLARFAMGRMEAGPWLFGLALLLLRCDTRLGGAELAGAYAFCSEGLPRLSILLVVLDESRVRARRLEVMNAITAVAVEARDSSGLMLTAMNELCRLYGARFAWFQLVEGEELVMKEQVGHPEWFTRSRRRVPRRESVIMPLATGCEATRLNVRSLSPGLRDDLERLGMKSLVLVPVWGRTAQVGVLGFGLTGRRSFTSEQLRFLTTTANQLGMAGETLRMFERVLHSQRQWLSTIDSIDDYILVHDAEPRVLRMNLALARRLERSLKELNGQPLASVLPNAEAGCPYCRLGKQINSEVADPCFGGYSLISTSSYVEDQGGAGTVHVICDRTERRAAEERYRLLFESVQEGVFVSTPEGKLLDYNPAFASMLGYEVREEMRGIDIGKALFLRPEQRAAYSEEMARLGSLRNYEIALRRKDGRVVTLMENSFATRDAQGKIERYQGFLLDITEKKRVEEDMKRRNRELGALNAMATMATQTFDLDQILQDTLDWTTELYGQQCDILLLDTESGRVMRSGTSCHENRHEVLEELRQLVEEELTEYIVRADSEVVTEQDLPRLPPAAQSWIARHGYESFVAVMMYSQRKTLGVLLISSPNKNQFTETDRNLAIAIARQLGNSSEKVLLYEETAHAYDNLRNAQEQLLQSEKMSAVGRLISGVAHELNNPLTAVLGYAQLLETEPIGERAQDYVRKLYKQTQRTHRVVQNLLSFSRQRKPIQSQVDLRRVMEDTLVLRESDLKLNNVQVERNYDPDVPFVTGDAHQLEQVFLNIINNAVDAIMDSAQSGRLRVRIYPESDRACIEFRDTGPGLEDSKRIFDPFYTTKKIGKGTGLGLSICYGIVKGHGGDIIAFNHEEGGAVFRLKLPIAGAQKLSSDAQPACATVESDLRP
jgi:two-component system NtrC family sensor kinase